MPGREQPRWNWVSSGHCPWGPAAPGLFLGLPVLHGLPTAQSRGPGPCPGHPFWHYWRGTLGGMCQGHLQTHTQCVGEEAPRYLHTHPLSPALLFLLCSYTQDSSIPNPSR